MAESISSRVARCLALFRDLVDPPDGAELDFPDGVVLQMIDEQSRFKVWSGNIGAHKTGMSSLDYRLRDASHIKSQVINLLKDLGQLVEDASAIARGQQTPWDQDELGEDDFADSDSDESPDTELGQIAVDMADVVNCLLRLTVSIRNPAPHDRYTQAKSTDASHYEPFDIQHVRSKFDDIEPWLADRLGKAISRRRQYLKYRHSHHEKLSHGLDEAELGASKALEDQTVASSIPSHLKEGRVSSTQAQPVLTDDASDAGMSQTSYATSMATLDRLTIPPLPEEAHAGPFQCCLCYMMIVVRDRAAWKKHVYGDLQPYVCLENDCVTPQREYLRRHEWIAHVRENHWKTYKCITCELAFPCSADCRRHFEASHPAGRSAAELDALVKLSEQPVDIRQGVSCPLCHETLRSAQQYQRHVGRHQEQLSLFALPSRDEDGEADGDDQDSDESDVGEPIRGLETSDYRLSWMDDQAYPPPEELPEKPEEEDEEGGRRAKEAEEALPQETILSCSPCNYYPAPGPSQRRKMDKHKLTDGHRRRTGQDDGGGGGSGSDGYREGGETVKRERFPCLVPGCGSTFNREDNLRRHVGRRHGLEGLEGLGRKGEGWEGEELPAIYKRLEEKAAEEAIATYKAREVERIQKQQRLEELEKSEDAEELATTNKAWEADQIEKQEELAEDADEAIARPRSISYLNNQVDDVWDSVNQAGFYGRQAEEMVEAIHEYKAAEQERLEKEERRERQQEQENEAEEAIATDDDLKTDGERHQEKGTEKLAFPNKAREVDQFEKQEELEEDAQEDIATPKSISNYDNWREDDRVIAASNSVGAGHFDEVETPADLESEAGLNGNEAEEEIDAVIKKERVKRATEDEYVIKEMWRQGKEGEELLAIEEEAKLIERIQKEKREMEAREAESQDRLLDDLFRSGVDEEQAYAIVRDETLKRKKVAEDNEKEKHHAEKPKQEPKPATTANDDLNASSDEDVTIRVKGSTVLKFGNMEMQCQDGAEINITSRSGQPEIRNPGGGGREGLIGSGLDEGETEALVDDDNSHRPVYTRMGLKHLEIATLMFYDVEFEREHDHPDSVLIKRWVPEWEQRVLWDHTRRLRMSRYGVEDQETTDSSKQRRRKMRYFPSPAELDEEHA